MVEKLRRAKFARLFWIMQVVPTALLISISGVLGAKGYAPSEDPLVFATWFTVPCAAWLMLYLYWRTRRLAYDPTRVTPDMPDPAQDGPPALRLLDDPADFNNPGAKLRFTRV
jgi:hypothetical protein